MLFNHTHKMAISVVLLFMVVMNWLPQIDAMAQQFLSDSINSNAIVFGVVRTLNGVISVIQSADIGIGVASVSIGEILDPVNDLVERFSGLLLITLTALGISQVLLLLTISVTLKTVFTAVCLIATILIWAKPSTSQTILRWILVAVFIRFILVVQIFLVWLFDTLYFEATGEQALSVLEATIAVVERLKESISQINLSELIFGSDAPVIADEDLGAKISSSVVTLIVGMLFKSIIIPMATLWLGYKVTFNLFNRPANYA